MTHFLQYDLGLRTLDNSKSSIWCVTVHCTMLVVFDVQCKMSFTQLCKAAPGNLVQHHTVLYLVQCAVCRIQCLVSCVQLEREREGGSMWSQMAPLPLINPWQGMATLGFTQHTAHWLLSVSHWTQHTEHCTQWL